MRMIEFHRWLLVAVAVICCAGLSLAASNWPKELGMHRALVRVDRYAPAVTVRIPWRQTQLKGAVVTDASSGRIITNVVHIEMSRERGDIAFEPSCGAGDYHVYYRAQYPESPKPDDPWLEENGLTAGDIQAGDWSKLPKASFVSFEAYSSFDTFTAMERLATTAEVEKLLARNSDKQYLLFPEDRKNVIRVFDALPEHWARLGPASSFEGVGSRGEFYTYQVGVYAARMALEDLDVTFEDLKPEAGAGPSIPAAAMRCFNKRGVDWRGRPFTKVLYTEKERVRPLWMGVQIPRDVKPGIYVGAVSVNVKGVGPAQVSIRLHVNEEILDDAGDAEPWRHSRLRWLDSKIGASDQPIQPFTPVEVSGDTIRILGRELRLGPEGLPSEIRSFFTPDNLRVDAPGKALLAGPVRFVVEETGGATTPFSGGTLHFEKAMPGAATWRSSSQAGDLQLHLEGSLEFDGYGDLHLAVSSERTIAVRDIRLEVPLRREAVPYMMGLGVKGGFRPSQHQWKWDLTRLQDSAWLGDVNGGVRWQFLDEHYQRPLVGETMKPLVMPVSWSNGGAGGASMVEEGDDRVVLRVFCGPRTLQAGQTLRFDLTLLLTPFKTLDMATHWNTRYYHEAAKYPTPEDAASYGVNVVNVHQGNDLNPWINYPFLTVEPLKKYVKSMHEKGIKTKIYYTVRELSTRVVEMWALQSLDAEIFLPGPKGAGHAWMQDHLRAGSYTPAWTAALPDGEIDTSINTNALSRWHNYYLEGLSWLMRNIGIDGLYLDGIGYNRDVFKRARRIMDEVRPGSLIDWHNGNEFQPKYGMASPANLYMEFFPYVNRVWFGEMFDYGGAPDYYLIEMSGIPFGVMGEMINGNAFYGPLYGMTSRQGWSWGINDPRSMLRMWDQFGIKQSMMIGYWVPTCPVKVNHPAVRATVYRNDQRSLVALANWSDKPVSVELKIDYAALGLDPQKAQARTIAVAGIQPDAVFAPADPVTIGPNQGVQVILEAKP